MRRIVLWVMSTLTALVLLFSYQTSHGTAGTRSVPAALAQVNAAPAADGADDSSDSGAGSGTATGTTYAGDAVSTPYGPVQVQVTVADGRITRSEVLQVPWNDGHDQMINGNAVPILNQEAVAAQSADIDMVSGATYTSQGYVSSLQSAIDQAHL